MSPYEDDSGYSTPSRQQKHEDRQAKKKIVLMGPRASGKTSIVDFLVKKTLARETLFLDSTRQPNYSEFEAFIPFELIDMPGNQLDPQAFGAWPDQISACIFVLDGQALPDASPEVANSIARSIISLYMANPEIQFHVFLHKMETGTPDGKLDMREDLRLRLEDGMEEELPESPTSSSTSASPNTIPNVNYFITSVYDHSVFDSMSRVIQRLLPCQFALERLLDVLCQNCGIDKAFLFHLPTKLYVSTDSSPVDAHYHIICSDLIDLFVDFGGLYGPQPGQSHNNSKPNARRASDATAILSPKHNLDASSSSSSTTAPDAPSTIRHSAASRVRMHDGPTLAHWEIDERLSLIAMLRPEFLEQQSALIDFNVDIFRQSILKIQEIEASSSGSNSD